MDYCRFFPFSATTGIRPADLYVAALPRSGSTMLAGLFTQPNRRLVIQEPQFVQGARHPDLKTTLKAFGAEIEETLWQEGRNAHRWSVKARRIRRIYPPLLNGLEKWGVKEVSARKHLDNLALLKPAFLLLLVRDIRDAGLSCLELQDRLAAQGKQTSLTLKNLKESAASLVSLLPKADIVIRYEDLVTDPSVIERLSMTLDWPYTPDAKGYLNVLHRKFEQDRHGRGFSSRSIGRWKEEEDSARLTSLEQLNASCRKYQSCFGYSC